MGIGGLDEFEHPYRTVGHVKGIKVKLPKLALAPLAAAAMIAFSIPASAATSQSWVLNFAAASGQNPGPFGTVTATTVDGNSNAMDIRVALNSNFVFVNTGGPHHAFAFNLANDGTPGVVSNVAPGGFAADGSGINTPFGTFSNLIDWTGAQGGPPQGNAGPLTFRITDAGGISFSSFIASTGDSLAPGGWLFSADLWANGFTGNVATNSTPTLVPEPETYAMMLVGFGLLGFVARRRRQFGNVAPA